MKKTPKKTFTYTCVVIPVAVANGMIGGISSVVTAYFFRPIWNKITKFWEKNNEHKTN